MSVDIYASGNLFIQQNGSDIQYSLDNSTWNIISNWPVTVTNTNPTISTILTVSFASGITTDNSDFAFIAGSHYITFDGLYNTLTLNGEISQGVFLTNSNHTIKINNFTITGTNIMNSFCYNFGSNINHISGFNPTINFCSLENCVNNKPIGQGMVSSGSVTSGTALITGCTNNAEIPYSAGGICGNFAVINGTLTITYCVNNGNIGATSGGIIGPQNAGIVIIENCINNGSIGSQAGGIAGEACCYLNTSSNYMTINKCINTSDVLNTASGGITGQSYGQSSNETVVCSVTNCYSTGSVINNLCGGICGINIAINGSPTVNITNCYTLGNISASGAGICGYSGGGGFPSVNITNCYSYGTYNNDNGIAEVGSGFNITNCYSANGSWSDTSANASLTGIPTNFYNNNPGTTWAKVINNTSTPYVLSVFNSAVYDPSMVEQSRSNYTSDHGLFQSDYSYNLLSVNNSTPSNVSINSNNGALTFTNVLTGISKRAEVFVTKGTAPYYNNYNLNTFAYSNICFPAKTPIQTDQGLINIDELNTEIHTIRNKKIVGITQTITNDKYLVCFEKDCLGKNVPCQKTFISQNHAIFNKGQMMKAKKFVGSVDNVYMKKYKGEVLYNVLMEEHYKMLVNNLICETLHPENSVAKLYLFLKGMTTEMQQKYIKEYNEDAIERKVYTSKK